MKCLICLCTVPDSESAQKLAEHWLLQRWAACVNEVQQVTSRYLWENELKKEQESLLIIKTTKAGAQKIKADLKDSHPYTCPEWIELAPSDILEPYAQWIQNTCSKS